jgi:hypothetical protein
MIKYRLLPDRFEHGRAIMFGEMQVEHDDAGLGILSRRPLEIYECNRLRAVAENFQDVVLSVLVQGMAQHENIRGVVFDHENPGWTWLLLGQGASFRELDANCRRMLHVCERQPFDNQSTKNGVSASPRVTMSKR